MSKKSDGVIADSLDNRWQVTHAPAAAATIVASVSAPQSARSQHNLETLSYTIKNITAGIHTVTTSVRAASVAGTVLASWDDMCPATSTTNRHLTKLGIRVANGEAMHFTQDTVLANVKCTLNATGWTSQEG